MSQRMAGSSLAEDAKKYPRTHADYNSPAEGFGEQYESKMLSKQANTQPSWNSGSTMALGDSYIQKARAGNSINLQELDSRMHKKADYMRAKGDLTLYNSFGDLWGQSTADWQNPSPSEDYDINETREQIDKHTDKTQDFLGEQIDNVWKQAGKMAQSV